MVDKDPRTRRLKADYKRVEEMVRRSDLISFTVKDQVTGSPPEKYIVTYLCVGIININSGKQPVFADTHKVNVVLDLTYPSQAPKLSMLTPVWHPNILHTSPYTICVNAAWWSAGRRLDRVILMVGEMIQYKQYQAENAYPFPLDKEVAEWVFWAEAQGIVSKNHPIDSRELLKPDTSQSS